MPVYLFSGSVLLASGAVAMSSSCCCGGTGACCHDGTCSNLTHVDCTGLGGTWQGAGTSCSDMPDPCATGACCCSDWVAGCSEKTASDCATNPFAVFYGVGSGCPDTCATGACCLPGDVDCSQTTIAGCAMAGGTFQGFDTCCPDNSCAGVTTNCGGACVDSDGMACYDRILYPACNSLGFDYMGDGSSCNCDKGRCCTGVGSCTDDVFAVDCPHPAANWKKGGTCADDPCEGSCCHANICFMTTHDDCLALAALCMGAGCSGSYGFNSGFTCTESNCCDGFTGCQCDCCCFGPGDCECGFGGCSDVCAAFGGTDVAACCNRDGTCPC